jgi:fatty acid synthase
VEQYVEVGLGNAPTLANLAAKTLAMPAYASRDVSVYNVGRDAMRVSMTDTDADALVTESEPVDTVAHVEESATSGASNAPEASPAQAPATSAQAPVAPVATAVPASAPSSGERPADLSFKASDAIVVLIAHATKIRIEQIGDADTTDTLTNGVSSRRNQLLMDISSELGVASVEGAAEAAMKALAGIVDKVAPNYQPFGPVVGEAVRDRLKALFGAAGVKAAYVKERVNGVWQLGDGWSAWTTASLLLDTREGASTRGGDLAVLPTEPVSSKAAADKLIDSAVEAVAAARGVSVSLPSAAGAAGGAVVDSAALTEFSDKLIGDKGLLASTARFVLKELGVQTSPSDDLSGTSSDDEEAALLQAVETELGSDWPAQVAPRFDERKAVLFDDRWASAREDLARLFVVTTDTDSSVTVAASGSEQERLMQLSFVGAGAEVAAQATWYAQRAREAGNHDLARRYVEIADEATRDVVSDVNRQIAVVTGVGRNSIAAQVVARLLAGGATVVATSHSFSQETVQWAKQLYRTHAQGAAQLWLLPANLSSYRDVDAVVNWIGSEQKETVGASVTIIKPAYEPDLFFPFAAPAVHGTLNDSGELFESQARLMLWGVERAIAGLAAIGADSDVAHKLHVVLPGSPNRGIFGGDGAYGEVKSAFDAILNRSRVEHDWADRVTFAHPRIGWVRGTGLMKGNDPLVEVVESEGIHTYSTEEISKKLVDLASASSRAQAEHNGPISLDLTGGLGDQPIDLKQLWAKAEERKTRRAQALEATSPQGALGSQPFTVSDDAVIKALPSPRSAHQPAVDLSEWTSITARPEDQVVIVSVGELGPWGSGRTRLDAELGIHSDGTVELSAAGILELAWNMGLLSWQDSPTPGWYDTEGTLVPEEEIAERYGDEVTARSGIRPFEKGMGNDYADGASEEETAIFLDHDVAFSVASKELAQEYVASDPEHTSAFFDEEQGEWQVSRTKGAMARVPRRATMTRTVGGQFPAGFDPEKWGIPASMIGDVDPIALWNIVTTVDAYISAGFSPVEILQNVHPSLVASTQGTGFGGMASMRKLYLDRFLGKEYPSDILQEALPNVVAAHVMQSYIGGYGNMVQPVSACATAAISLEEGFDKIKLGKADFVVTGAIDDIGVESVNGFGYMNATADSAKMYAKGIEPRFFSRAGDRRRGGFLESQGGGTILLTRGDIALKMGLPVAGVVGYVHSFADGAHTSIPAPGLGAVAAARGGTGSLLVRQLAALGVAADDIAVVSKHDTSTNANDPNEAELHNVVAQAIGRTTGNPLYVVSQKTLTGHAKGGAAIFQVNGLTQMFSTGVIPGNAALDCLDPKMRSDDYLVWLRSPLHLGGVQTIKAGLATSLGFGHVSGFVAVVHPGAFEASVAAFAGEEALEVWRRRANQRLEAGSRRRQKGMMGAAPLYEAIDNRRFTQDRHQDSHEIEIAMLLDPQARLSDSGVFDESLGKNTGDDTTGDGAADAGSSTNE